MVAKELDAARFTGMKTPIHKFPYTRRPVDSTLAKFKGQQAIWEPMLQVRIGIPKGKRSPRFHAYVDSGSPWTIFHSAFADFLGIELEAGEKDELGGIIAGLQDPIYFHKVTLFVEDRWTFPVRAGFMKKLGADGILGREGFFDNFRIRFDQSANPPVIEVQKVETIH